MRHATNGRGYQKLQVDGLYYIYDTATNAIVPVKETVHRIIDDYFCLKPKELSRKHSQEIDPGNLRGAIHSIKEAQRRYGMFAPLRKKDFCSILDRDRMEETLSSRLSQLILYVTDGCNQRCSYCWYRPDNPQRATQRRSVMDWGTAKASIDYFLAHSSGVPWRNISFYGGEPLLRWPFVRRCIDYVCALQRDGDPPTTLRVVTNLTLLSEHILDYLVANDVSLQVSLDGPRHIHDARRSLPDGRGTWNAVVANLHHIRSRSESYFREHVFLNCTYDIEHDLLEVFDFFNTPPYRNMFLTLGFCNRTGVGETATQQARLTRYSRCVQRLIRRHLEAPAADEAFNHAFVCSLLSEVYGQIARRPIVLESGRHHANGICLPGGQRLFADCDGTFYPCEKCWLPGTAIGDARNGISLEAVRRLLEKWVDLCQLHCQECWAYRLCRQCFIGSFEAGRMSGATKNAHCDNTRRQIKEDLQRFVFIWKHEHGSLAGKPFSLHSIVAEANAVGVG